MTPSALRPWVAPAAAAVLAFVMVRECNGRRAAEAALKGLEERARLERVGQEVVQPVVDLGPRVRTLEAQNADLRKALEGARRAAPDAKPVAVTHAATGPVLAHVATPGTAAATAPLLPPVPAPAGHSDEGATCLLRDGDTGEIRVDEVELQTRAGNRLLVGAASAWRLNPEARLFGGPFSAPTTEALEKPLPEALAPRWGAGPVVGVGTHGPLAGALLVSPEGRLPLLGWRVSVTAVAALGGGDALALAGVVVRP